PVAWRDLRTNARGVGSRFVPGIGALCAALLGVGYLHGSAPDRVVWAGTAVFFGGASTIVLGTSSALGEVRGLDLLLSTTLPWWRIAVEKALAVVVLASPLAIGGSVALLLSPRGDFAPLDPFGSALIIAPS